MAFIATVKQKLNDIEKAISKGQRGTSQLIEDTKAEINRLIDLLSIPDLSYNKKCEFLDKIQTYRDFVQELERKQEIEKQKQELQAIRLEKQLKKQDLDFLTEYFYTDFQEYFKKFENKKAEVFENLQRSEVITDEIEHAKKIYCDMFTEKEYFQAYENAKNDVFRFYKGDILAEQEKQKRYKEAKKHKSKNANVALLSLVALGEIIKPRKQR